jgi:hypothetical protein
MVEFIPAQVLKSKFDIFGHFYSVQVAPQRVVECRSVLEIVESAHTPKKAADISNLKPDAIFIMMNPGSSQPLVAVDNRIHADAIHELTVSLVPTKPDTTQYQVMRLMHYCGWRHVRVLNLSDLRCTKSNIFFQQFKGLESEFSFDAHSVFSDRRKGELALKLTTHKAAPVVRAWGLSESLDPLIERCVSKLTKFKTIRGLMKDGMTNKYLHPLPTLQRQKLLWVDQMVAQCLR